MKKNLNMMFMLLTLLLLQGCADIILSTALTWGRTVEMKNSEGHTVDCSVSKSSAMFNGRKDRDLKIERCVIAYEKQGYKSTEN